MKRKTRENKGGTDTKNLEKVTDENEKSKKS